MFSDDAILPFDEEIAQVGGNCASREEIHWTSRSPRLPFIVASARTAVNVAKAR
jgi:hypothetical protein